jgi:hypothetical protein
MSLQNRFFAGGSPLGMASGGYAPSYQAQYQNSYMRDAAIRQAQAFASNDSATQYMLGLTAGATGSKPGTDAYEMQKFLLAASTANGVLGGGSSNNLIAAAQNTASAGFRYRTQQGVGASAGMGVLSLGAAGAAANAISRHFIHSKENGGGMRINRTAGLDRDGLAGVLTHITNAGMLGPIEMTGYGQYDRNRKDKAGNVMSQRAQIDADLRGLVAQRDAQKAAGNLSGMEDTKETLAKLTEKSKQFNAAKPGEFVDTTVIGLDPKYAEKMNKTMEQASKSLVTLKNVFGPKAWAKLHENLEQVTGMKVGDASTMEKATSKFKSIENRIRASGQDVTGVMTEMTDAYARAGGGFSGNVAARASLNANTRGQAAARNNGNTGYNAQLAAKEDELGMQAIAGENTAMMEVAARLNSGGYSKKDAERARELLANFENASSVDEQLSTNAELSKFQQATGDSTGEATEARGAKAIAEAGGSTALDVLAKSTSSMQKVTRKKNASSVFQGDSAKSEAFSAAMENFNTTTMSEVQGVLAGEGTAEEKQKKLAELLGGDAKSAESLMQFNDEDSAARLKYGISIFKNGAPGMGTSTSKQDARELDNTTNALEMLQKINPDAYANREQLGFMESMRQGIAGDELTPSQVAKLAVATSKNGAGVFKLGQLNSENKFSNIDNLKGLEKVLSEQELKDLKSGDAGKVSAVWDAHKDQLSADADGNVSLVSKDALTKAQKSGETYSSISKEIYKNEAFTGLSPEGKTKVLDGVMEKITAGQANPKTLMDGVKTAVEEAKKTDKGNPGAEVDPLTGQLVNAANNAGGAFGKSGPGQFIGVMEVHMGNSLQIAVSKR